METSPLQRLMIVVLLILGASSLSGAVYLFSGNQYTIYDGSRPIVVSGRFRTVADVLAAADLEIRPEDRLLPPPEAAAEPGTAIQLDRSRPVVVRTESGSRTMWTTLPTLGAFLAEAGIQLNRTDQVFADQLPVAFASIDNIPVPQELEIGRFLTVTIEDGSDRRVVRTATQTVGEALNEAGLTIYAADGVEPGLGAWLAPDMVIRIRRSAAISINVDGRVIQTRSHHTRPLDVLAEAGIGLVGLDYTRPDAESNLEPGDAIHVVRVTEDFRIEDETIPFQTLWQASDELDLDQKARLRPGQTGIARRRVRVRYENGIEVGQSIDGEWVAREPVDEIMGYGTRIQIRVVDTPQGPRDYWRVVRMRVTSYTAASSGKDPTDPGYGRTASGLPAGKGVVAVDRGIVPFRSTVYVPGYGIAVAGDTGGGVRGRWIDLGYDERNFVSWSGYVDVYYLTPVPAAGDINYLLPAAVP